MESLLIISQLYREINLPRHYFQIGSIFVHHLCLILASI